MCHVVSIKRQPGFFSDWGRLGLGGACKKRFTKATVGGRTFDYADLQGWSHVELSTIMNQALAERQPDIACWALEALLIQYGGDVKQVWPTVVWVLGQHPKDIAIPAAKTFLKYVPDAEQIKPIEHGAWVSYVVGQAYLELAQSARGTDKTGFLRLRPLALHFLGQAREQAAQAQKAPSADPYAQAAAFAGVAALAAASYESGFSMAYKGTRSTSSSSSE